MNIIKRIFEWDGIAPGEGGFIQAALAAAPYVISGLGALFGKKKKYMDPETLRQKYGPAAIGKDTQELTNRILNSPYGQQLLASAAEQGQGIQTEMERRAAASGLSPDTGGQSGASDFAVSAGTQAQTGLERQTRAGIIEAAIPAAEQFNQALMQQGLADQAEQNAQPNTWQRLSAAASQAAAGMKAANAPATTSNVTAPMAPVAALTQAAQTPAITPVTRPVFQSALQPNVHRRLVSAGSR